MSAMTSASFKRLVKALKSSKKTCTVVEQCCGGKISSSIMQQPGSSSIYYGGSIAYNTKKGKPLLLNDDALHASLTSPSATKKDTKDEYIQSKLEWTAKTSVAFCESLGTDFAIAEGGAAGPTFAAKDLNNGFAVLTVAGRDNDNTVKVLKQKIVETDTNCRQGNMSYFAKSAADLLLEVMEEGGQKEPSIDHVVPKEKVVLDRATHLRSNATELSKLEKEAKFVLVKKNEILFQSPEELGLLSYDEVLAFRNCEKNQLTFLGLLSDDVKTPIFGIDIKDEDDREISLDEDYYFADTRTNAPFLSSLENGLALHMMAYANWQRRSCFCPLCGAPQSIIHAGTTQKCTSCNTLSWPRQDPSMIASITSRCGKRILLARSKRHPPKVHTVLAGFVEAGETFEDAVARETFEETGIRIDEGSVKYVGSQPWPFPQSSMIAFTATADDEQPLNIDENELVDAKWFDREDVILASEQEGPVMQHDVAMAILEKNPDLNLLIPPKRVIARTLIDNWLHN